MTEISGTAGVAPVAATELPHVVHGAPAAVLMIDLATREVVYANASAIELTGDRVHLPVDVDAWGDAAGLTDLGGQRMSETNSPLSLVAAGVPVAGEPVAVHDSARRGSTVTDEQRDASEGRLLWVTGFGLAGVAPTPEGAGLESRALVVFLQISGTEHGDRRQLEVLRDRAVVATEMSFTITDPRRPDDPLIWVNPSFTRLTGYTYEDVVGRNCRLLQGPNTDRAEIERISRALSRREPFTSVLLNYRKDGSAYWNQVSISPVFDGAGELINFVGVQNDVTERVTVEQERATALADAESSRSQLRLLAEATTQMTEALDVGDACARLARIVVPQLADLCAVDLFDRPGVSAPTRLAVAARDAADEGRLRRMGEFRAHPVGEAGATGRVPVGDVPRLIAELPETGAERHPDDPGSAAVYDELRLRSAMVVPIRARGRVLGTLTLLTQLPYGRRYGSRDLHLAADLAGRAGLTVDNARLYEVEHAAAATLQHSLLPVVPEVAGLQVAARYLVGADGNQVGGDWYDVLPLPDGAVGIAVGDVVGHDLAAAAAMGQLRGVVRSYAWEGRGPGSVLDRCDQLVQGLEMAAMATAFYARIEPPDADGVRVVRYANAGHPAPLVLGPDGGLRRLDEQRSPMIGAVPMFGHSSGRVRAEAELSCPLGSVLLLYTDGLTDMAGHDADERTALLERTVVAQRPGVEAEELVEGVLAACAPTRLSDDVALLAVRLTA
ncbi:GAF domain-containing SpoIIE family protein phosphatase [Pseudonocardia abyssalis]|uniref:SpoIIE family protein phosphatase n=1 Tax=Pseudonocardia abyssalis TaxID=2792008 RepID=A0ABS6UVJ1_9PSEU|nr:GAF domain-containing SpoIIE family protein phosphatase [Pseudonocardia abyssalis]MBW0115786.1 SpoIIE family protein phosphatase [Pseudonocardia abyssalis]MBW0136202.1 SpoIIE family protein phosphatase [Pseudonocardia abyssalis]